MARLPLLLPLVLLLWTPGCQPQTRLVRSSWADLQALATDSETQAAAQPVPGQPGYSILLAKFDGGDRQRRARQFVAQVAQVDGTLALRPLDAGGTVYVVSGMYAAPTSDDVQRDLKRIRQLTMDGAQPCANAGVVLAADPARSAPSSPWDLELYRGQYTLQIGYYDPEFGPDFRQAAEQACKVLRDKGEESYFYHGPRVSLVTVGLFTEDDFGVEEGVQVYGPRMRAAREKYPQAMGNGRGLLRKIGDRTAPVATFIVKIE